MDKIDVPNNAQPGSAKMAGRRVGLYPVSRSSKGTGAGKDMDVEAGFGLGGDVDRSVDGDPVLGPDIRFFSLLWFCRCRWMRQYIA